MLRGATYIKHSVALALHLGQQDLGVANEYCYHAPFGQIVGLRNLTNMLILTLLPMSQATYPQ